MIVAVVVLSSSVFVCSSIIGYLAEGGHGVRGLMLGLLVFITVDERSTVHTGPPGTFLALDES